MTRLFFLIFLSPFLVFFLVFLGGVPFITHKFEFENSRGEGQTTNFGFVILGADVLEDICGEESGFFFFFFF